ncbi:MAG: ParB/RepB/Spo0J family partition protein, partial [Candidatus Saccharimonadales bacterium]
EHLHQQFSMTYEMIAKRLGKALSTVNNISRLLQLPKEAIEALNKKSITEGHARAVLALKEYPEYQMTLLKNCIGGWSVRQAERYVTSIKSGVHTESEAKARVEAETPETKSLGSRLGTQVHIRRMARGGRLEIAFSNDEELARLIERIH